MKDEKPPAALSRVLGIFRDQRSRHVVLLASAAVFFGLGRPLLAQATIGTGSIIRTMSDPSTAVINGA